MKNRRLLYAHILLGPFLLLAALWMKIYLPVAAYVQDFPEDWSPEMSYLIAANAKLYGSNLLIDIAFILIFIQIATLFFFDRAKSLIITILVLIVSVYCYQFMLTSHTKQYIKELAIRSETVNA